MSMDDRNLDILEKAVINLLNSRQGIFYSSLILQMKRTPMDMKGKGCMGVGFDGGQVRLVYDPIWLEKLTVQQVMFALEHECIHLVLSHLDRIGDRDMSLGNIAADLCVNGYILDDPGPCVKPYDLIVPQEGPFKDMPKGKHFEWYYDQLYDKAEKYSVQMNKDGSTTVTNCKTGESKTYRPNNHDEWESMQKGDESLHKEVIKVMVKEAYAEAKARGNAPGGAISELIESLLDQNTVNWRSLLRRQVAASILSRDRRASWKRPNRRFGNEAKGHVRIRRPKLVVAIDTSGSMSVEDLCECVSELRHLQKIYNASILCIETDAAVQRVYDISKFTPPKTDFHGRGGTATQPTFDHISEHGIKVDCLIYFSDMGIDTPTKPRYPVIWVVPSTAGSNITPPFGSLVQITKK